MTLLGWIVFAWTAYGVLSFLDIWEDMKGTGFRPRIGDFFIIVAMAPIFSVYNLFDKDHK